MRREPRCCAKSRAAYGHREQWHRDDVLGAQPSLRLSKRSVRSSWSSRNSNYVEKESLVEMIVMIKQTALSRSFKLISTVLLFRRFDFETPQRSPRRSPLEPAPRPARHPADALQPPRPVRCRASELRQAVRALQVLEADAPSGSVAYAGARRAVALVVVAACARFPPVRRVGLGPDYRRGAVRAGGSTLRHDGLATKLLHVGALRAGRRSFRGSFRGRRTPSAGHVPVLPVAQDGMLAGQGSASNAPRPRA
jgi:hypothetical protein